MHLLLQRYNIGDRDLHQLDDTPASNTLNRASDDEPDHGLRGTA